MGVGGWMRGCKINIWVGVNIPYEKKAQYNEK